jgi:hypothetical protein
MGPVSRVSALAQNYREAARFACPYTQPAFVPNCMPGAQARRTEAPYLENTSRPESPSLLFAPVLA